MTIMADGSSPICSQLSGMDSGVLDVRRVGIPAAWKSGMFVEARGAHGRGQWQAAHPACVDCNQWHQLC
jgi:hypothetical protein